MKPSDTQPLLEKLLAERILVIDGAMGTMIQQLGLSEEDFRGERFRDHPQDLKGDNDLLSLTQPAVIEGIHRAFLDAGADVIETNTFNSTRVSQADYRLEDHVYEINLAAAQLAAKVAREVTAEDSARPRFVAGSMGPTSKTLSMSRDVEHPERRDVTFVQMKDAYAEQARGLIDGGADILLPETTFDTLNLKAAIFAIEEVFQEKGVRLPVILSVTFTQAGSNRTLSGQTLEAFWISVAHARPLAVAINCAVGATEMRPYVEELSTIAPVFTACYPNAGLPNAMGEFDERPEDTAAILGDFAARGWVNLVGGCCGTTPDHIREIAAAVRGVAPRV
ncbi:MAG: 5-methyltetrahydrofolate--homocysteine methyltransferase, partial [Candidatus Binatota bacterium]|nr:5-methyltetrahydrofolate--homocysteine methyltransferase [Candidatus Binatota bacterium]